MSQNWQSVIRENIHVPAHIQACANACLYDLMHGPSFTLIPYGNVENVNDDCVATYYADLADESFPEAGDVIEETYTGQVGDAVRSFIDDLPWEAWVDMDWGGMMTSEPEAYETIESEDENGELISETIECDWASMYHIERSDIIAALFGRTFAREFR